MSLFKWNFVFKGKKYWLGNNDTIKLFINVFQRSFYLKGKLQKEVLLWIKVWIFVFYNLFYTAQVGCGISWSLRPLLGSSVELSHLHFSKFSQYLQSCFQDLSVNSFHIPFYCVFSVKLWICYPCHLICILQFTHVFDALKLLICLIVCLQDLLTSGFPPTNCSKNAIFFTGRT